MSRILCLTALACIACAAHAQAPLSLPEAQRIALERSHQVAGLESGASAARDLAVAAGRLPDPVLSLSVENVPIENAGGVNRFSLNDEPMTMRRIGLMQELPGAAKRALRSERFEREAGKTLAEAAAARASIRRDTAIAWLDAWYAEAMARVMAEQRVRGLQELQAAEAEYRAGRQTQPELLMARASLAMLDDRAAELERRAKNARVMLARWAGAAAERPLAEPPDFGRSPLAHHSLDEQLAAHAEIQVMARQVEVAAAEARLAEANRSTDWTVELAYSRRASSFGDMVSVGVRVPLPWDLANRQDRELSARLADVRRMEAMRDEALRQHAAEIRMWLQEWESNRGRIARYEREIVPLAAARAEATLAAFRGGKTTMNEVLSARRGELEARLQALQIEAETARLWAQLEFLTPEAK